MQQLLNLRRADTESRHPVASLRLQRDDDDEDQDYEDYDEDDEEFDDDDDDWGYDEDD